MVGRDFVLKFPFSNELLCNLVLALVARWTAGITISNYISAIGTSAVWLDFEHPCCEWLSYVDWGISASTRPPDKVWVHSFPYRQAFA